MYLLTRLKKNIGFIQQKAYVNSKIFPQQVINLKATLFFQLIHIF